jgi:hypothetical protein
MGKGLVGLLFGVDVMTCADEIILRIWDAEDGYVFYRSSLLCVQQYLINTCLNGFIIPFDQPSGRDFLSSFTPIHCLYLLFYPNYVPHDSPPYHN